MTIKEGQPAPDFTAPATSDTTITLSALKGKKVVLYFYPKDSTPGCTTEGQNFRDLYPNFQEANCEILGVSRIPCAATKTSRRSKSSRSS